MTSRIKFGLQRGPGTAPGFLDIECPCGYRPVINVRDLGVKFVKCFRCGAEYDRQGFVLQASVWDQPEWRTGSTFRERVALLAYLGPVALKPEEWKYNARREEWCYIGDAFSLSGTRIKVTSESTTSLAKLERAWRVPRADALRMVGQPEE